MNKIEPEVGVRRRSLLQDRLPVKFQDVKFNDPKFKYESTPMLYVKNKMAEASLRPKEKEKILYRPY